MSFLDGARSFVNGIPILGGITESIWGSPEQEEMNARMGRVHKAYQQYRPQMMEAQMNAFNNMSHAFAPTNNLLTQMYGQGSAPDMGQIVQNPFPQQMQKGMYSDAFGNTPQNPYFDPQLEQKRKDMEGQIQGRISSPQKFFGIF
jgi:hypothetical protein